MASLTALRRLPVTPAWRTRSDAVRRDFRDCDRASSAPTAAHGSRRARMRPRRRRACAPDAAPRWSRPATDRVAREIVNAFRSQRGSWSYAYDVGGSVDQVCDVRFRTASADGDGTVVARDGIVAIVNPRWKALGAPAGPIVAAIPDDRPDELAIVSDRPMHGAPYGSFATRSPGSTRSRSSGS